MSKQGDDGFDGVREALVSFKEGEIDVDEIRNIYGDVDGIDRSIAVAKAKRDRSMSDEELDDRVCID